MCTACRVTSLPHMPPTQPHRVSRHEQPCDQTNHDAMHDMHLRVACTTITITVLHPFPPQAEEMVELTDAYIEATENETRVTTPSHQYLYKPINTEGDVAVLLMNSDSAAQELTADFSAIPGVSCSECRVTDVWAGKDTGTHSGSYKVQVASHDAAFLLVSEK